MYEYASCWGTPAPGRSAPTVTVVRGWDGSQIVPHAITPGHPEQTRASFPHGWDDGRREDQAHGCCGRAAAAPLSESRFVILM